MKRLFIAIFLLVILAGGGAWWWARQSVPQLDGEWRLAGLGGPVEVLHDAYGVPHAYARDTGDAWFVAGALHARDRFWQMELYRRAAYGRLSEVLGEATLPIDQRMLTLGIRAAARAELARLGPSAKTALTRYAEGVNAAAATRQGRQRPLEFQLLGITPAPWTAEDSLAVGRLLAFRLAENQGAELVRHALTRALGQPAADALTGRYPDSAPTVLGELAETTPPPPATTVAGRKARDAPSAAGAVAGSEKRALSAGPGLARPDRAARQQQCLGGGRHADHDRPSDSGQRSDICSSRCRPCGTSCTSSPPDSTCRASPCPARRLSPSATTPASPGASPIPAPTCRISRCRPSTWQGNGCRGRRASARGSIVFATWDAEEWGLIGSTEYVEDDSLKLLRGGVAYLNQDVAAQGPSFGAGGSPSLRETLRSVVRQVPDPRGRGMVYDVWRADTGTTRPDAEPAMGDPGGGSDFAGFYNHLGIPHADWGFGGPAGVYHSAYDTFEWMRTWGDPGFLFHATAARIGAAMALRLANAEIHPYDYVEFARTMQQYVPLVTRGLARNGWDSAFVAPLAAAIDSLGARRRASPSAAMRASRARCRAPCANGRIGRCATWSARSRVRRGCSAVRGGARSSTPRTSTTATPP